MFCQTRTEKMLTTAGAGVDAHQGQGDGAGKHGSLGKSKVLVPSDPAEDEGLFFFQCLALGPHRCTLKTSVHASVHASVHRAQDSVGSSMQNDMTTI